MRSLKQKIQIYYFTAIFSFVFALVGFSYNAWRMEVSEDNNNIRTAAFEVLENLAEFEQNIYAAHYDNDIENGSPRIGWVKVGLVVDLSLLIGPKTLENAEILKQNWAENWTYINEKNTVVEGLVADVDKVRASIKVRLTSLE